MSIIAVTSFFFLAAAPAEAAAPPTNGSGEQKLICKSMKVPGQLVGKKRICRTRDQWLDDKAQTRLVIDRAQIHQGRN
jgi:hypothetical protein